MESLATSSSNSGTQVGQSKSARFLAQLEQQKSSGSGAAPASETAGADNSPLAKNVGIGSPTSAKEVPGGAKDRMFIVKNTFLDFAGSTDADFVRRAVTAPVVATRYSKDNFSRSRDNYATLPSAVLEESDREDTNPCEEAQMEKERELEQEFEAKQDVPRNDNHLCRYVTLDYFERVH